MMEGRKLTDDQRRLVEDNLGLVHLMIRKRIHDARRRPGYYDAALMGLVKAAMVFNPALGHKFSTWACNCIKNAILGEWTTRERRMAAHALFLGFLPKKLPVDLPVARRPWEGATRDGMLAAIGPHLDFREQRIVELRKLDGLTLEEVGVVFGLTKERIRQIEIQAMAKLRLAFPREDDFEVDEAGSIVAASQNNAPTPIDYRRGRDRSPAAVGAGVSSRRRGERRRRHGRLAIDGRRLVAWRPGKSVRPFRRPRRPLRQPLGNAA